jgi:hypothetical protein
VSHPFEYHKPTDEQAARMIKLNGLLKVAYDAIVQDVPSNRERSLAITNLQQARMWVNAAILEMDPT